MIIFLIALAAKDAVSHAKQSVTGDLYDKLETNDDRFIFLLARARTAARDYIFHFRQLKNRLDKLL